MADFPMVGGAALLSEAAGTSSRGIQVTSAASTNTMGTIVELVTSTSDYASGFYVTVTGYSMGSANPQGILFDILIGAGGSEDILVEGVVVYSDNASGEQDKRTYHFPITIPSGSRISARCQSNSANADAIFLLFNYTVGNFGSDVGYGICESIGFDKASSKGVVIDPGGTTNTKGSWVEMATTSGGFEGLCVSISANLNNAQSTYNFLFDIGFGSAGNEEVAISNIYASSNANEQSWAEGSFYNVRIPEGTRIAVRSQCSGNQSTDRLRDIVIHGVR